MELSFVSEIIESVQKHKCSVITQDIHEYTLDSCIRSHDKKISLLYNMALL